MNVRIEQEYCTGDGLCQDLCPDVFEMPVTPRPIRMLRR